MKVKCKFCVKQVNGKCVAKKNVSVELTKSRRCSKYEYDENKDRAELRRRTEAVKNGMSPTIHKLPQSYYDVIWSKLQAERNPVSGINEKKKE